MGKNTITRQELYDLVWKESLTAISKRFNIPFTHLRKICSKMNVPIPPNGHWSKLQFGKPVEITKLPHDYQGENELNLFPGENDITNPDVITFYQKSNLELIKKDKTLPLKVTKKLFNPEQIIISAENCLTKHPLAWWNNRGMVRTTSGHINIRVAPASINRALRFLDAFVKLLKARGHNVITEYSFAKAVIDDVKFKFSLNEKNKQKTIGNSMNNIEYKPTGLFTFTIEGRKSKSWSDAQAPIEGKLAEILAHLETEANIAKEERLIYQEQVRIIEEKESFDRKIREEKERVIREQQQRIENELSDFKDFYKQAKRWQRARFMRDYINAVEANATDKSGLTTELRSWIDWANNKVDWYDPMINKEDELLTNKDKKAL